MNLYLFWIMGTFFFEEAEGWSISQPNNKKTNANITKLYMVLNMRNLIINTTQKDGATTTIAIPFKSKTDIPPFNY